MPYGQEIGGFNPQLAQAIAQQEQTRLKQQQALNMMSPDGKGGVADIVSAVLGGSMAKKYGNQSVQGEVDINRQIAEFQQAQAQAQEMKAQQAMAAKYAREDSIRAEKQAYQKQLSEQKRLQDIEDRNYQIEQLKEGRSYNENIYNTRTKDNRDWQTSQRQPQIQLSVEDQILKAQGIPTKARQAYDAKIEANKPMTSAELKEKDKKEMLDGLSSSVNELYKQLMNEGTETWGSDSKKMATTYNHLLMQAKEAYKLGVLSGPDMEIMENVINNPTTLMSGLNPWAAGNTKGQLSEFAKRFKLQDPQKAYDSLDENSGQATAQQINDKLMKY